MTPVLGLVLLVSARLCHSASLDPSSRLLRHGRLAELTPAQLAAALDSAYSTDRGRDSINGWLSQDGPVSVDLALEEVAAESLGRDGNNRLAAYRQRMNHILRESVTARGYVSSRVIATAISLGVDIRRALADLVAVAGHNTTVVAVRGASNGCQFSPVCLDLACGRCFDPLTSLHTDCGPLSHFRCEGLVAPSCLPWTCAKGEEAEDGEDFLLRNYMPRSSNCQQTDGLDLVHGQGHERVTMTGLGIVTNSLTRCSEFPVCWDEECGMCYDSLEQRHAPCAPDLSVESCGRSMPGPCQPVGCWQEQGEETGGLVLLRDYQHQELNLC